MGRHFKVQIFYTLRPFSQFHRICSITFKSTLVYCTWKWVLFQIVNTPFYYEYVKKRPNLSSFFIIKGLKIVLSRKSLRTTGVNNFYWKMTNYFPASMMISDDCYNTIFKSKFYLVCLRK